MFALVYTNHVRIDVYHSGVVFDATCGYALACIFRRANGANSHARNSGHYQPSPKWRFRASDIRRPWQQSCDGEPTPLWLMPATQPGMGRPMPTLPPTINPITGQPEQPRPTDPGTGLPALPNPVGPQKPIYGPPQPLPSYGPGMYIIPGCKEIDNVRAGLQAACTAIKSATGQACIARLSSGFRNCINSWCHSNQNIYCGSPTCAANKSAGKCTRGITDQCGDITICTSIIGNPRCWNQGINNFIDQIGKTLVHEAMHTCGMGDSARYPGEDPNNPAEDVARCIFGLPGHEKGY